MHVPQHHARRDAPIAGVTGTTVLAPADPDATTGLILSSVVDGAAPSVTDIVPLVPGLTITTSDSDTPTATPAPSPSPSTSGALMKDSSISTSTVVAACVGAFAGLAVLICLFIWWSRHSSTKGRSREIPRSPMSENRNARGETERQQRVRSGAWNKLDEEEALSSQSHGGRHMTQEESDEKNFSMFKKRTLSMRTTRTAKALEEHGIDLPPIAKYHPDLAKELALEEPTRPFTARQDSGVSWDGETLGDDSFLSLRSVRIETGTMSPTLNVAKMTPPAAMAAHLHKWESAEVLTVEENPFSDVAQERRKSSSNPFFSAGEVHRSTSRRSRSNSRGSRGSLSRSASKSGRGNARTNVVSQASQIDPFADINSIPAPPRELPAVSHSHSDSVASSSAFGSERAMKSLIAALDLSQEEIEERLRVVSMQPSLDSRYSELLRELNDGIGITDAFPAAPTTVPRPPPPPAQNP